VARVTAFVVLTHLLALVYGRSIAFLLLLQR